ncbi:MAG: methyltransferase domain-containing protein [Ignavibacteriales bacterium]|nr:methyltransferase domain-containing protein [Ignavibacteriales bacterium]
MHYDPIKDVFAAFTRRRPFWRVPLYKALNVLFLRSWYVRRELRAVRREFGDREIAIYDAGCGYAQYTHFMTKKLKPCRIHAVDVKREWIDDARAFFAERGIDSVEFAVEDLRSVEHENRFDLVLCVDVMEHIVEDVDVLRNFSRALKPGGVVVINSPSIFGGSDVHDDHDESFIGEHARDGYSIEDLAEKSARVGLEKARGKYGYGFWGDKAWRLSVKTPMRLLNVSMWFLALLPLYYLVVFPFSLLFNAFDYWGAPKRGSGVTFVARKPS